MGGVVNALILKEGGGWMVVKDFEFRVNKVALVDQLKCEYDRG